MRQLKLQEIKEIQLEILKAVDKCCADNDLRYSLAFGTLLGAVRHKGFIPWDDDVDIMLPRPDYNRFINVFNESFDSFKVRTHFQDPNHPYTYGKVEDARTKFIETITISYDIGINIDIFPVDGVPSDTNTFKRYFNNIKLLRNILSLKLIKPDFKRRNKFKNIILFVSQLLLKLISYQYLVKLIEKKITKYSYDESKYAMMTCVRVNPAERVDKIIFEEYSELQFENNSFPVIARYDYYLKILYGDYMKIPPLEQRVTHHLFKAYLR